MKRLTALLVMLVSALTVAACGSGSGGPNNPITVVSGGIAYFVVRASGNRDTVQVVPGGQANLSGTAYDAALDPLALVGDTTWTSRDTTIARVDTHGLVTTIATGNVWIVGSFLPANAPAPFSDSVLVQVLSQQ
jgi:opacity protein-like surface antigen